MGTALEEGQTSRERRRGASEAMREAQREQRGEALRVQPARGDAERAAWGRGCGAQRGWGRAAANAVWGHSHREEVNAKRSLAQGRLR
jgi:hypothetical protein